jgi:hypothetical protein
MIKYNFEGIKITTTYKIGEEKLLL